MYRATRHLIQQRQPHTAFVVEPIAVQPWPHRTEGYDIQDRVHSVAGAHPECRFAAGWRVHRWDPEHLHNRIEPWWFVVSDWDSAPRFWDVMPADSETESVIDQGWAVLFRDQIQQRVHNLPPDLLYRDDQFCWDTDPKSVPAAALTREELTRYPRSARVFAVVIASS
jgi:hypothetical protein